MFGTTLGWSLPINKRVRPLLLNNTLLRDPNFVVVWSLDIDIFWCFFFLNGWTSNVLRDVPCPISLSHPIGREVATEERNLDPLAGRLVVFLCMTNPSVLIVGGLLPFRGGVINTNLAVSLVRLLEYRDVSTRLGYNQLLPGLYNRWLLDAAGFSGMVHPNKMLFWKANMQTNKNAPTIAMSCWTKRISRRNNGCCHQF